MKEKKIGILTFHRANNYGAVLQAYALCTFCSRLQENYECKIIDYRSEYLDKYYSFDMKEINSFKSFVKTCANYPIKRTRSKVFNKFRKKYLQLSKVYKETNIGAANAEFDIFLFGSDQIWNARLTNNDLNFLGNFVIEQKQIIAYAASFGSYRIQNQLLEEYKKLISKFDYIGMRENYGKVIVDNLIKKESKTVMDPVFLLDKEEWDTIVDCKTLSKKYIFLYHLQGTKTKADEYAMNLSRLTGMKVINVQGWAKKYPHNMEVRFAETPNSFLSLIKNAEYVITDSFHCTSFSIIFEKKFWAICDKQSNYDETRVGNLLKITNLESRLLTEMPNDLWNYDDIIDYDCVKNRVISMRNDSINFLKNAIFGNDNSEVK